MFRIEYETESMNGAKVRHVMFADDCEECEQICDAIDRNGYKCIDVSRYDPDWDED